MSDASPADQLLDRLDAVRERLLRHASSASAGGLTEADPATGERWELGQVWAHLAEFPAYWMSQVRLILDSDSSEPVPFGRVKSDPYRIAAIEAGRQRAPSESMEILAGQIQELRALVRRMPPRAWSKAGRHSTLGVMPMPRIFDEFLVGHLEEHADQLDQIAGGERSSLVDRSEGTKGHGSHDPLTDPGGDMPTDAITLLEKDHRTVDELFHQFMALGGADPGAKQELVDEIIRELTVHAAIEEQFLYPALRQLPEGDQLVSEAMQEHQEAKEMLAQLGAMDPRAEGFEASMTSLMENVRHHVQEEEGEAFPKLRETLGEQRLGEMGGLMEEAKQKLS